MRSFHLFNFLSVLEPHMQCSSSDVQYSFELCFPYYDQLDCVLDFFLDPQDIGGDGVV